MNLNRNIQQRQYYLICKHEGRSACQYPARMIKKCMLHQNSLQHIPYFPKKSNRRVSAISVDTDQTPWKGISSGSILFATHPGVLDISDGIKMDMFKF